MKISENKHNPKPNYAIVGNWEMKYSFHLGASDDSLVNATERYVLTSSGICEHTYEDDSGMPNNSSTSKVCFKVEGNHIFFMHNGLYDVDNSLEFRIESDLLILDYELSEEVYVRNTTT